MSGGIVGLGGSSNQLYARSNSSNIPALYNSALPTGAFSGNLMTSCNRRGQRLDFFWTQPTPGPTHLTRKKAVRRVRVALQSAAVRCRARQRTNATKLENHVHFKKQDKRMPTLAQTHTWAHGYAQKAQP